MTDEARELLTKVGTETSLRYAMHMIMAASLVCSKRRGTEVGVQDIKKVYTLFVDLKRSTNFLMAYQQDYMFNELDEEDENADADDDTAEVAEGDAATMQD
jgi:RuvB-like protein 2